MEWNGENWRECEEYFVVELIGEVLVEGEIVGA